jgi:hypothetical protein
MTVRAVLLIALTGLLTALVYFLYTEFALPSRHAAVVLPLLEKFSSKDDYSKIEHILGKPDSEFSFTVWYGITNHAFRLDDLTSITVDTDDYYNSVLSIVRTRHGVKGTQIIFHQKIIYKNGDELETY